MVKKGLHHRGQSLWKHKALVCPLITNSTCNPGLRLGDNEPLITEETKRRENSSPRTCLLRAPSTKRTPESSSSSALLLLLPFFLHFILIRLLATLNLLFSRSSKNYHSAKPRKLTWLHLSGGHRCWHSVSFNGSLSWLLGHQVSGVPMSCYSLHSLPPHTGMPQGSFLGSLFSSMACSLSTVV